MNHMKQKGRSMRYVLNERFALRGWDRLPWAVVRRPNNAVQFVDKSTFRVLSLCDGTIDLALPLFDERIRTIARELERQGIVRALAEGERAGLTDDQRYVCHPNRCIRTAHWSITGRCNYRCKHCYMDAPDALLGELDHDTVMDIARQIVDAGILRVNLTGGEPLVRRDFLDIVDYLVDHHVVIHQIYSNGRLVTRDLLDALDAHTAMPSGEAAAAVRSPRLPMTSWRPIAPCACCIAAATSIGCAWRRRPARRRLLRARQLDAELIAR